MGKSPVTHKNNIYSPGSDKLTEEQLYLLTSCQPGSRVIRAFSGVKTPFLFSDLAVQAAKSENEKGVSTSETARISSPVNKFYRHGETRNSVGRARLAKPDRLVYAEPDKFDIKGHLRSFLFTCIMRYKKILRHEKRPSSKNQRLFFQTC